MFSITFAHKQQQKTTKNNNNGNVKSEVKAAICKGGNICTASAIV